MVGVHGGASQIGKIGEEAVHFEFLDQHPMQFIDVIRPSWQHVAANGVRVDDQASLVGCFDIARGLDRISVAGQQQWDGGTYTSGIFGDFSQLIVKRVGFGGISEPLVGRRPPSNCTNGSSHFSTSFMYLSSSGSKH